MTFFYSPYNLDRLDEKGVFMGNQTWQLQEAKNKFSQLVEKARKFGPQVVTKHGKEAVVILSFEDYKKMVHPENNLIDFLQNSPLSKAKIDFSSLRQKDKPRDITL